MAFEGSAFLFAQLGGSQAGFVQPKPDTGKAIELRLDASLSEEHKFQSDVTQNPIEDGSVVTDHVVNRPFELSLTGEVTDSPIQFLSGLQNLGGEGRSQQAFDTLFEMYQARTPMTVQTGLRSYANMVMQSLTIPRRAEIGQAIRFTMSLRQVTIVASETVDIPPAQVAEEQRDQAQSQADKGKQQPKPPSAATDARSSTLNDFFFN